MKKTYIAPSMEIEFADFNADFMFAPESGKTEEDEAVTGGHGSGDTPEVSGEEGGGDDVGAKGNTHFFGIEW